MGLLTDEERHKRRRRCKGFNHTTKLPCTYYAVARGLCFNHLFGKGSSGGFMCAECRRWSAYVVGRLRVCRYCGTRC